ncbi:hypothetical protein BLNAU_14768 [Blattamonas nauphoetae]|uniref:Uncharacterized protein n=1 Tax=Blattamonas nauphoetae TaxID=2049346 RepID=A0ABQ9XJ35_9EUKA|nr:hypothetical protein BLNAU_14768 [Blattamonas nauphoetae]
MPPKPKLGRKRNETQSKPLLQCATSSKSNKTIIHTTFSSTIKNDNDSSVDLHSISSTTDVLTTTANDRLFVRISKQILQYELNRKRINVESMMEQAHLEGDEITLPTLTTSDWQLVLQDSITTDDLRQGCLSLFEQVNSEVKFTPIEVFYIVQFLEYTTLHMQYREYRHVQLLEAIFHEDRNCQTKLTSAFIKLVSYPSNSLRTAALSFFAVGISNSSRKFSIAMAMAGHLPKLFESLKPHEVPLNETTIDFHRHITSIVDNFFSYSSWDSLIMLGVELNDFNAQNEISKVIDPIFRPSCAYLRHLLTPPACPTDYHNGLSLLTKTEAFKSNIKCRRGRSFSHSELLLFLDEVRTIMMEAFASSLGLSTKKETLHELLFGGWRRTDELGWAEALENILVQLSKGRQCSDFGLEAFLRFMSNRPGGVKAVLQPDGTFSIEVDDQVKSTLELPTSFISSLIPTRPHYAAAILTRFRWFASPSKDEVLLMDLKIGRFSQLFDMVNPSKLPFTEEYVSLHTQLVEVMQDYLDRIRKYTKSRELDKSRSELDELYHAFQNQTSDYIVHLSLRPFALVRRDNTNIILTFFTQFFRHNCENNVIDTFREKLRKEMDEAALSSSSPPFILTSELVCQLTDEEIMNVVDRIVALLESDTPLDDDTILRMCTFHTNQLKSVYLPELFRKAGRTTEQYFHAFKCLISLPFDYFTLCPIKTLLTPKPNPIQPTLDEWDDVDLATVGVVMPTIHEDRLSFNSASSQLLQFVDDVLPQISSCVTRLNLLQLERLLTPSNDVIFKFSIQQYSSTPKFQRDRETVFIELSRLCVQRIIAQCLSRIGFFSRMVCGLLDANPFNDCSDILDIFLRQARYSDSEWIEKKPLRSRAYHFLEEGWQDVLEFLFVRKQGSFKLYLRMERIKIMIQIHGANINSQVK